MSNSELKVNLILLKKLVSELETTLDESYIMRDDLDRDAMEAYNDFVVEARKASGVASGVIAEATLLLTDINKLIQYSFPGTAQSSKDKDDLDALLKSFAAPSKTGVKN